ncbi:hypothetical protein MMC10_001128 [Thelotrema lepadinum]|nr:hypothetical protein [Thelotrema lepadinum]
MRHTSLPPYLGATGSAASGDSEDPQDIIMSSDSENPAFYPPPPRIAARLNRQVARKSANSSRRNSVTSLHSNRSNRSCHGRVHNTHIAQHLRRASILESRKARLADRAAYAEKVRLRAQEAKAAPRTSRGENRALAAQQAREKYLAQVAATCAEEVKRAKKIAEEHKEKKAAEHSKLKEEMKERFAEAERRRLVYQQSSRRNRTTSSTVAEGKIVAHPSQPRDEISAAKSIQRTWRFHRRRKILSEFFDLDLDLAHVQASTFEAVSNLLAQEKVIERTGRVLNLCGLQDVVGGANGDTTAVRTFLSAYLILGHPRYVLSHEGDREEYLMEKAKVLLMQFQRVISRPPLSANFSSTSEPVLSLSEAFSFFQLAFTAWKNHDSSTFVETMLAQFAELDAIWQTVKNDTTGGTAGDYKEGIRYNQTLLLARLKRLAGPEHAIRLANEAVKARRRSKAARKPVGDIKPRSAASTSSPAVSLDESPSNADEKSDTELIEANEPTDQLKKVMSPLPENRIVVHELAINREYRIDVDTASEARQAVNRLVFNSMREDLLKGSGNSWVIAMAETIREKILRVIPPGKPLHASVSEGLDLKAIQNQIELGIFSYEKFFAFMNNLLPKLVSPARDPLVKELVADHSADYVDRLAKLMHIIDLLSLDYANYLLVSSAPELLKHATSYEQHCFSKAHGNSKLVKTSRWWKLAQAKAITEFPHRPNETNELRTSLPSPQRIYATGLVDLFIALPGPQALDASDVPETLELDVSRIQRIRTETFRMITIATIILTAKNLLKRDVRTQWRLQAQRMWDLPDPTSSPSTPDSSPYLSILESSTALPPPTKTALQGTIDRVLADARNTPNITHPVTKVLLQKLKSHILSRLAAASSEERVRSAASASEVLSSGGLAEFIGRVGGMVEEMGRVRGVDWEGHGEWLDRVAGDVAREGQA